MVDNGNRLEADSEALYLFGLGGPNGLRILGGSLLALNNVNVYTMHDGQLLHVNTLFPPGVAQIAYDEGFIALNAPTSAGNCTADLSVGTDDAAHLSACLGGPAGSAPTASCQCSDTNYDTVVDLRDFATIQRNFGLGD